jgi:hypothetical protein
VSGAMRHDSGDVFSKTCILSNLRTKIKQIQTYSSLGRSDGVLAVSVDWTGHLDSAVHTFSSTQMDDFSWGEMTL